MNSDVVMIEKNDYLWDAWSNLEESVHDLKSIVQNDDEVSKENLFRWYTQAVQVQTILQKIIQKTLAHIGYDPERN